MAEPINLNKARKAKARADQKTAAVRNRAAFGRRKAETMASKLEQARARRALDQAKLDE